MDPLSIALMAAPTVIRGISALTGGSKPTHYENEMFKMADVLKSKAMTPGTETNEYKSGKAELNAFHKKNTERAKNLIGAGNYTNEAKLASMQAGNEVYASGLNKLLANVSRLKDYNLNRYLNTLGTAEQAKQNRIQNYNTNLNSILEPVGQAGQAFAMAHVLGG